VKRTYVEYKSGREQISLFVITPVKVVERTFIRPCEVFRVIGAEQPRSVGSCPYLCGGHKKETTLKKRGSKVAPLPVTEKEKGKEPGVKNAGQSYRKSKGARVVGRLPSKTRGKNGAGQ